MRRLLLLPAVILFCLMLVAVGVNLRLSLFRSNIITEVFIGVGNYVEILSDSGFHRRLINSLLYAVVLVPAQAGIPLVLALFIFDIKKSIRSSVMFALYLPSFTAGIIISTVWRWILHPRAGLANWLLSLFGAGPIMWMGYRGTAIIGISMALTSVALGFYTLVYMTALLSVPSEVIDAARIDGASAARIRVAVLVPIVSPTIKLITLLVAIGAMQVWETIYMMAPVQDATNLMYDLYQTAFRFSRHGLGAAKSVVLMLIIVVLAVVKRRVEKPRVEKSRSVRQPCTLKDIATRLSPANTKILAAIEEALNKKIPELDNDYWKPVAVVKRRVER